eukprot:1136579-Pelagomonas_calceolata.AAC.2
MVYTLYGALLLGRHCCWRDRFSSSHLRHPGTLVLQLSDPCRQVSLAADTVANRGGEDTGMPTSSANRYCAVAYNAVLSHCRTAFLLALVSSRFLGNEGT